MMCLAQAAYFTTEFPSLSLRHRKTRNSFYIVIIYELSTNPYQRKIML